MDDRGARRVPDAGHRAADAGAGEPRRRPPQPHAGPDLSLHPSSELSPNPAFSPDPNPGDSRLWECWLSCWHMMLTVLVTLGPLCNPSCIQTRSHQSHPFHCGLSRAAKVPVPTCCRAYSGSAVSWRWPGVWSSHSPTCRRRHQQQQPRPHSRQPQHPSWQRPPGLPRWVRAVKHLPTP